MKNKGGATDSVSWMVACPFHRKSARTGCKKSLVVQPLDTQSWAEASDDVILSLKNWANFALEASTQSQHMCNEPIVGVHPSAGVIEFMCLTRKPVRKVPTDAELAAGVPPMDPDEWYPPSDDGDSGDEDLDEDSEQLTDDSEPESLLVGSSSSSSHSAEEAVASSVGELSTDSSSSD